MFPRILLFTVFSFFFILNASAESIALKISDTIAGYSTMIQTVKTDANTNLTVRVEKPNGSVLNLPARTNNFGYAEVELDGYHTKKAGLYKTSTAKEYGDFGGTTHFEVFAGTFSPVKSEIITDKATLAAKTDTLTVQVKVKDQYENPIKGHMVQLLSSRTEDIISTEGSNITNEQGIAVFNVESSSEGMSIFTAIDQNVNQDIRERKKIVFYAPNQSFSIGGSDFSASLLEAQNSSYDEEYLILDHFEVEFPNTVQVNDDQNHLKVTAKDANGNTVRSYTGTIKIAVDGDDNAIIPSEGEYTFTEKDQGEKEFALAMIFTQVGNITVEVFDYEANQINTNLKGEKTITVVEKKQEVENTTTTSSDIEIKSPSNGSEIASPNVTVSGLALPNTNLKLMLDDIKVAEVQADMEGFFATTLRDLDDGLKEIYVIESEGMRRASAPVKFTVDATPPRIDTLSVFPEEAIYPQTSYTVTVYSEPNLDYAKVRVAGIEEPLTESAISAGKYEGSFFAPADLGTYNIDVLLADRMGNIGDYRNQETLEVIEKIIVKPSTPQNLAAIPADGQLEVTWTGSSAQKVVDHYKVYVGEVESALEVKSQSRAEKALITSLENGQEYFIAVSSVDTEGIESEKSEIITATPQKAIPGIPQNIQARAGDSVINLTWAAPTSDIEVKEYNVYLGQGANSLQKVKSVETLSTDLINLSNDATYFVAVSAVSTADIEGELSASIEASPESLHSSMPARQPLRAIPGDSKVTLSWDAFDEAEKYKVSFGIQPGQYEARLTTADNATSFVVDDLMNGLDYYFTVTALDATGFPLSENYPEVQATPNGFGFKIIPSKKEIPRPTIEVEKVKEMTQTGPETWIFLAVSLIAALALYISNKQKPAMATTAANTPVIPARKVDNSKIQF